MKFIIFLSQTAILIFLVIVVIFGLKERKNLFELFIKGCYDGVKVVWDLFPTLLALVVSVGMLSSSGVVKVIGNILSPFFNLLKIPSEIIPMVLLRPISGSTTTAIATDIMKNYGVDTKIGLIASIIMGATETTIYVVALYTSKIKIKNVKEVLLIGLLADFIGISLSVFISNFIDIKI